MKKSCSILLLIVFIFVCPQFTLGQDPCNGKITLDTQAKVNAFTQTKLEHKLVITGEDVTDLRPLHRLKEVQCLSITGSEALRSLDGLDSLHTIHGTLEIYGNDSLIDIFALRQISQVEKIDISYNKVLQDLSGLHHICGSIEELTIEGNWALENLNDLSCLSQVAGEILISRNHKLKNIGGLASIQNCVGFTFSYNTGMVHLDTLKNLNVEKRIDIWRNDGLVSIGGFNETTRLERLRFFENGNLIEVSGFQKLYRASNLWIEKSYQLSDLQVFRNLTYVRSLSLITNISSLTHIGGLGEYSSILIEGSDKLHNLVGIDTLTKVKELILSDLDSLTSLDDLKNLVEVETLEINSCDALKNLEGLSSLEKITYKLGLDWNRNLATLEGLTSLKELGSDRTHRFPLQITSNKKLRDIEALGSIHYIRGIIIENNTRLTGCCLLTKWFSLPFREDLVKIHWNGYSCNRNSNYSYCDTTTTDTTSTDTTVVDTVTPNPFDLDLDVTGISPIFPNPSNGPCSFYYSNPDQEDLQVEMYDPLGRRVNWNFDIPTDISFGKKDIDFTGLAPGRYFIRLVGIESGAVHKFVLW